MFWVKLCLLAFNADLPRDPVLPFWRCWLADQIGLASRLALSAAAVRFVQLPKSKDLHGMTFLH
ncbi:hypothetical protein DDB_G0294312 [Dictyostelium discoideum AX4]|uniref:hypothetical protein n=1 Tax=Dictyostelium discoideum AX4 TaxID=352472 RepID=UPI00004E4B46|nr:hypothetical protein DDB_G0294312 [Dictyostelium discoideum AX4]EAL60329.1 hypothetical protein DDB_G0294312 [Dictyostelium discoideum AX4]|eukprot:XP_628742.1 hypothetical protein DDB_G0294312 [Dictyostelium discoideum AX4]